MLFEPAGTKHKTMLEARTGEGSIRSFPRQGLRSKVAAASKSTGLQNKTFHCQTCDVHVNSDTQLKQVQTPNTSFQTITAAHTFRIKAWRRTTAERPQFSPVRSSTNPRGIDFHQEKDEEEGLSARFKATKASPDPSQKSGLLL